MGLTDSPVLDASNVNIHIVAIELLADDAPLDVDGENFVWQRININRKIDVLALRGGNRTMLINNYAVTPKSYSNSRLILDPSKSDITINGGTHPLDIPLNVGSSPRIAFDYNLDTSDRLDVTFDFNLRASIAGNPQDGLCFDQLSALPICSPLAL
ncbi:DUF4382 domain-containing protein [Pelagibaculum spongiae]|uniref:DUF4382 domain-containing protein n=1 Tax=Pelagibaculum spongiae TaxID=2080658 RepID=UPI0034E279D0